MKFPIYRLCTNVLLDTDEMKMTDCKFVKRKEYHCFNCLIICQQPKTFFLGFSEKVKKYNFFYNSMFKKNSWFQSKALN